MRFVHLRMHLRPCLTDRLTGPTASCMQSIMQLHNGGVVALGTCHLSSRNYTVVEAAVDLPQTNKNTTVELVAVTMIFPINVSRNTSLVVCITWPQSTP